MTGRKNIPRLLWRHHPAHVVVAGVLSLVLGVVVFGGWIKMRIELDAAARAENPQPIRTQDFSDPTTWFFELYLPPDPVRRNVALMRAPASLLLGIMIGMLFYKKQRRVLASKREVLVEACIYRGSGPSVIRGIFWSNPHWWPMFVAKTLGFVAGAVILGPIGAIVSWLGVGATFAMYYVEFQLIWQTAKRRLAAERGNTSAHASP